MSKPSDKKHFAFHIQNHYDPVDLSDVRCMGFYTATEVACATQFKLKQNEGKDEDTRWTLFIRLAEPISLKTATQLFKEASDAEGMATPEVEACTVNFKSMRGYKSRIGEWLHHSLPWVDASDSEAAEDEDEAEAKEVEQPEAPDEEEDSMSCDEYSSGDEIDSDADIPVLITEEDVLSVLQFSSVPLKAIEVAYRMQTGAKIATSFLNTLKETGKAVCVTGKLWEAV